MHGQCHNIMLHSTAVLNVFDILYLQKSGFRSMVGVSPGNLLLPLTLMSCNNSTRLPVLQTAMVRFPGRMCQPDPLHYAVAAISASVFHRWLIHHAQS